MIDKIIGSIIFVSCLFALFLSLSGVEAPIWFGDNFRGFIVATNEELTKFHIAIPNIPYIPDINFLEFSDNFFENIITGFHNFVMGWATFVNGLITILNFVILAINSIINLLVFIFTFLKNLIILRDEIAA